MTLLFFTITMAVCMDAKRKMRNVKFRIKRIIDEEVSHMYMLPFANPDDIISAHKPFLKTGSPARANNNS